MEYCSHEAPLAGVHRFALAPAAARCTCWSKLAIFPSRAGHAEFKICWVHSNLMNRAPILVEILSVPAAVPWNRSKSLKESFGSSGLPGIVLEIPTF